MFTILLDDLFKLQDRLFVVFLSIIGFTDPVSGIDSQGIVRIALEERFHKLATSGKILTFANFLESPLVKLRGTFSERS